MKTPCSYAACPNGAITVEDGWPFCDYHRTEHRLIKAGAELPDLAPYRLPPVQAFPHPHGTDAAVRRHYRKGTPLCDPCRVAASLKRARQTAKENAA